jgi:signal transduction histidine kinase
MMPFADDGDAAAAYDLLGRIKQLTARLSAALYARAKERPIPLGDGRMFGEVTNQGNREIDGDKAYQAVREKYGQAVADKAVTREATQKGIEVDLRTSGDPLTVAGDRVHLEQVLLNLMINSIEALSSAESPARRLAVRTSGDNGCVTVSVSDTGPGIPHALLERVFDPFFTTKPEGMGIGLSISRSIIEAHEGGISAENDPQGGAAMRFWLPRCQGEAEAGHGHGANSITTEGRRSSG